MTRVVVAHFPPAGVVQHESAGGRERERLIAARFNERARGAYNGTAPEPVSNREFATALGAALHRPARLPVPGILLRARYGQLAQTLTTGARVLPAKPLVLGYRFRYPQVRAALAAALSGRS